MEDRQVDRLQTFFNNQSVEKTMEMYNELDALKNKVEKAGRSTKEIYKLIGLVADVLVESTSNANKIIDLTKALDNAQMTADRRAAEASDWRRKYFNARAKIDKSLERSIGVEEDELDFNSTL